MKENTTRIKESETVRAHDVTRKANLGQQSHSFGSYYHRGNFLADNYYSENG